MHLVQILLQIMKKAILEQNFCCLEGGNASGSSFGEENLPMKNTQTPDVIHGYDSACYRFYSAMKKVTLKTTIIY